MTDLTFNTERVFIPPSYKACLSLRETQTAIKKLKDYFERALAKKLNLSRVSAPLFVRATTGLNDNLNGVEGPVSFRSKGVDNEESTIEIVHSLAKWKRMALYRYAFPSGEGLYTDMNAIRKDEELGNAHSVYVDQWDWEKVIDREQRNKATLQSVVESIYEAFKGTEDYIVGEYPHLEKIFPEKIHFLTSQELEDKYPQLTPKEREHAICRELGAVFIMEIGGLLKSGVKHDSRAPDYDDWKLNGDILVWYPLLNRSIELSSMGIRADRDTLVEQLVFCNCEHRKELEFHKLLLEEKLPFSVGGGLGMSRICMVMLKKAHIGEVQASLWDEETVRVCQQAGVDLL